MSAGLPTAQRTHYVLCGRALLVHVPPGERPSAPLLGEADGVSHGPRPLPSASSTRPYSPADGLGGQLLGCEGNPLSGPFWGKRLWQLAGTPSRAAAGPQPRLPPPLPGSIWGNWFRQESRDWRRKRACESGGTRQAQSQAPLPVLHGKGPFRKVTRHLQGVVAKSAGPQAHPPAPRPPGSLSSQS